MIRKQQVLLLVAVGLIAWMGVYPPWQKVYRGFGDRARFSSEVSGYHWIFSPPDGPATIQTRRFVLFYERSYIDVPRLAVQWTIVALLAGTGFWLTGDTARRKSSAS